MKNSINETLYNNGCIIAMFVLSLCFLYYGVKTQRFNIALAGVVWFWFYGLSYSVINLSDFYAVAIMHFTMFTFLLSRPLIASLYNVDWTYWSEYAIKNALLCLLLSEFALTISCKSKNLFYETDGKSNHSWDESTVKAVRSALIVLVIFAGIVTIYASLKNYLYFRNYSYETMYVAGNSQDPAVIRGLSTLFPYSVFAYLATMPSKKNSTIILVVYVLTGMPSFMLGNRSSLVLKIAFATTYFLLRNYTEEENEKKWITNKMKVLFVLFVIGFIFFLGAYNYIRSGKTASNETYMPIFIDFFYRQGTTFDTLCQGFHYESSINALNSGISFTFGTVIDNIKHNTLSQLIFGAGSLGSGNSLQMVLNSNNLAHKLSYVALGEASYLAGYGRGSSFLLENYYDGGLFFVFVFSLILGTFLTNINLLIQKKRGIVNIVVISMLANVFFIPRATSSSFILFLVTPHFWLLMAYVLIAVWFARNSKTNDRLFQKLHRD